MHANHGIIHRLTLIGSLSVSCIHVKTANLQGPYSPRPCAMNLCLWGQSFLGHLLIDLLGLHMPTEQSNTSQIEISINEKWCKRCGICSAFCPADVYETDAFGFPHAANVDSCTSCFTCVVLCPDFAIDISTKQSTSKQQEMNSL